MRPGAHRPAVHFARRAPVLYQVLRGRVRQHVRRVRQSDRHRLKSWLNIFWKNRVLLSDCVII